MFINRENPIIAMYALPSIGLIFLIIAEIDVITPTTHPIEEIVINLFTNL